MKLEKFDKKKKKKYVLSGLIILLITIVGIVFFRSYALYQESKSFDALKGKVGEFSSKGNDITIAVLINDEKVKTFPKKYEGYKVEEVTCTKNAKGTWNEESWKLEIENLEETNTICSVSFTRYAEEILNGADPKLGENLIPVIIADDGVVTKADTQSEWYNYTNKIWANAVILEDETITYDNGETIPESNIESYFVWIPRYKYKIWDEGNYDSLTTVDSSKVHQIQVEFETTETAVTSGSTVNSWLTHPAFVSFGTNGIWVGKFESGYKGATTTSEAQSNTSDSSYLQIKPNVYSWRSIQVANAHLVSYNYDRNLDSHMMKNTEWGAVAYLQHSAYGSQASVRINNNSAYITGYGALNEPTTGNTGTNEAGNIYESTVIRANGTNTFMYNTETGYLASTTGNISGVYDMSGGAWEYMMGVMADSSGNPMSGRHNVYNSGFVGTYGCPTCDSTLSGVDSSITSNTTGQEWPTDEKYYDLYTYGTSGAAYKNRILGDATGEMGSFQSITYGTQKSQIGSWYDDEGWFVTRSEPWFLRSSARHHGSEAGVFSFGRAEGNGHSWVSFRVVLAL